MTVLGKTLWDQHENQLLSNCLNLIEAPSGFGKSLMLKYGAKKLNGLYLDDRAELFDGSLNENINLGSKPLKFPNYLLEDIQFDFDEDIRDINEKLSTGQRQRVVYLRSITTETNYIFFDETISGLQSSKISELISFTSKLFKNSERKIFYVIHNYIPENDLINTLRIANFI